MTQGRDTASQATARQLGALGAAGARAGALGARGRIPRCAGQARREGQGHGRRAGRAAWELGELPSVLLGQQAMHSIHSACFWPV